MVEIDAYNEALKSGQYEKHNGLSGKYDNVRRFWEDEEIGLSLRPYLERLIDRKHEQGEKLRVLDIGCGSGDGFELLIDIKRSQPSISDYNTGVVQPEMLELYKGIDINEGLLNQAQDIYKNKENMVFINSDINTYDLADEPAYDIYLANYGTLSHNTDEQTVELLSNIVRHSTNGAIILIDWLGRFSYEWQTLWTHDFNNNQWMDYVISYIQNDNDAKEELTHFSLRYMGRSEAIHVYQKVKKKAEGEIILRKLADRSSFVGRHMDTAQYNPHSQPLRRLVNSLFEPSVATNLDELLVYYVPKEGFKDQNSYYQHLTTWWNYLINHTKAGLEQSIPQAVPAGMPSAARRSLNAMKKLLSTAAKLKIGNPRNSLIEPQLAYCLRELEMGIQRGLGCGHGFVAIFEIVK